jgi:cbb3-type cytochrome oxidase subunit 3
MTYIFNDFLGLLFVSWVLILALHFLIGGILSIFYKEKKAINIQFTK